MRAAEQQQQQQRATRNLVLLLRLSPAVLLWAHDALYKKHVSVISNARGRSCVCGAVCTQNGCHPQLFSSPTHRCLTQDGGVLVSTARKGVRRHLDAAIGHSWQKRNCRVVGFTKTWEPGVEGQ
jgi:hypothetical protein